MNNKSYISDFVGLDLLRFLLSLTVMLVHYYFFYYRIGDLDHGIVTTQPFFSLLGPVYKWGGNVVQIFWMISGIIFYSVYYEQIVLNKISFREFSILRLSRLYPLHLVTLLLVTILQAIYFGYYHTFFMYQTENLKHFFLQIFFMGAWYPFFKHSFNVPAWSVSVEVFVYIFFFLVAAGGLLKKNGVYILVVVCVVFEAFRILNPLSSCMVFFFCGCLLAKLLKEETLRVLLIKYGIASIVLGLFTWAMRRYYPTMEQDDFFIMLDDLLIPVSSCIILLFIIIFRRLTYTPVIKLIKGLGNMTYSTYLIHFPIQLAILLIFKPTDASVFNNPLVLVAFLLVCVLLGWVVFEYFEKPVQKYVRSVFDTKRTDLQPSAMQPSASRTEDVAPVLVTSSEAATI